MMTTFLNCCGSHGCSFHTDRLAAAALLQSCLPAQSLLTERFFDSGWYDFRIFTVKSQYSTKLWSFASHCILNNVALQIFHYIVTFFFMSVTDEDIEPVVKGGVMSVYQKTIFIV